MKAISVLFVLTVFNKVVYLAETDQTEETNPHITTKYIEWPTESPVWEENYKAVFFKTILSTIINNSNAFPIGFPIKTIRCEDLKTSVREDILERNINSVYPILSEHALKLYAAFILHKRVYGNKNEIALYAEMSLTDFINRLLKKRAVMFMKENDQYILLNTKNGIGIDNLPLHDCLSYDEIKMSALLSVSSYSYFINNGNRKNEGKLNRDNVQEEGIVISIVGPRFEKRNFMEYQEIIISEDQNTVKNGYGEQQREPTLHNIICKLYEEPCYTFNQVQQILTQHDRFVNILDKDVIFDKIMYSKRLTLSFDTLLHEANDRAMKRNTTAFVHVVGIGLGDWKLTTLQFSWYLDTFLERIRILGNKLNSVTDIVFSYFDEKALPKGRYVNHTISITNHSNGGIAISFTNREPHTKLTGEHEKKLLVVSYAGDGNALPGNTFWNKESIASGDLAQAYSSQTAELHNPHINPQVCASNLRIATKDGVITFNDYKTRLVS